MKSFISENNVLLFFCLREVGFFAQRLFEIPHCLTQIDKVLQSIIVHSQPGYFFCPFQLFFLPLLSFLIQLRGFLWCAHILLQLAMAEDLIWCSAQHPHPFMPDIQVQMWWQEDRGPGVRRPAFPLRRPSRQHPSPKRGNQGWGSSADEDEHYNRRRVPTPWVSLSSQPPPPPDERIPTTPNVHLPPSIQSPRASDADGLTGFRRV